MPQVKGSGGSSLPVGLPRSFSNGMSVQTGDLVFGDWNYLFRRTGGPLTISSPPIPSANWTPVSGNPVCRIIKEAGTAQAISTGVAMRVTWAARTVTHNTGGNHYVTSDDGIVVPTNGLYLVRGQVAFSGSSAGTRRVAVIGYLRGGSGVGLFSDSTMLPPMGANPMIVATETILLLQAGDTITLNALHDVGADLTLSNASPNWTTMFAMFLGT